MSEEFTSFVGVDWSGANKEWLAGLQVSVARPGSEAPTLMSGIGPKGRWSRQSFVDALLKYVQSNRALIGLDFAFGFPTIHEVHSSPSWQDVEDHCRCGPQLYGGGFFRDRSHPLGDYVNGPWGQGIMYKADRLRTTERIAARTKQAAPSTMLNGVGAAGVGFSSISGMRSLLQIRRRVNGAATVWPFEPVSSSASVLLEVFPRYFPLSRGLKAAMRHPEHLNRALAAFGSEPYFGAPLSEDEGDAIITAAALRHLSGDSRLWTGLPEIAHREGWIFGVPPD